MKKITGYIRATRRAALSVAAVPAILGLTAVQGLIAGPVFRNYTAIPNTLYRMTRRMIGIKVVFNSASAPLVKDKPVWFVANHITAADAVVLAGVLDGTFVGKGDIMKWPVIAQMARTVKFIGVRRSAEYNAQSRAKIIKNINAGFNIIMFPEGTTNEGKDIYMFHAGLITSLFGEKGIDKKNKEVLLKKEVVVQPVAIRIKSVNGKDALNDEQLRESYIMSHEKKTLKRIWKRMMVKNITMELTALSPLRPADFKDARELINKAALDVAGIVNPGQTVFEKAKIPVYAKKSGNKKTSAP